MKKLTALTLVLLCVVLLFASCQNGSARVRDVYDKDWTPQNTKLTQYEELSVNAKSAFVEKNTRQTLMAVFDTSQSLTAPTLNVFSAYTDSIVKTVTEEAVQNIYVHFPNTPGGCVFSLLYITWDGGLTSTYVSSYFGTVEIAPNAEMRIEVYDARGALIGTIENEEIENSTLDFAYQKKMTPNLWNNDTLFRFDTAYYTEEDGALKLVKDFGLTYRPTSLKIVGDYYFSYSSYMGEMVAVYDLDFERVYSCTIPGYADIEPLNGGVFPLSNGNFILQYTVALPDDAKDYDLLCKEGASMVKKQLVIELHNVKRGCVKTLGTDYMFLEVTPCIRKDGDEAFYWKKGVENIAVVREIPRSKLLDENSIASKPVVLSNNGKVGKSLQFVEGMTSAARPIAKGIYQASTEYNETVLLDSKGKVLLATNLGAIEGVFGNYFYNQKGIYDFEGNVVYDLKANGATVTCAFEETAIVSVKENACEYAYLFVNGSLTEIAKTAGENASDFEWFRGGCYVVRAAKSTKRVYYNEFGEQIAETDKDLTLCLSNDMGLIFKDRNGDLYKIH